jgi:hypothetical protein
MIRRVVLALCLVGVWLAVLGWAAGLSWRTPLAPREHIALGGQDFRIQLGSGERDGDRLRVRALAADGTGVQTAPLAHLRAQDFSVLRYRIEDFPKTLELSLVFRRADAPDDLQAITLPAPRRGDTAVDLSSFAEWQGSITELGFAEYATAQLVPPSAAGFEPFHIAQAQLESASWSALPSRLLTDWFGYRPWDMQSINTQGPGIGVLGRTWMQPVIVLGALLSVLAAGWILRWPRMRVGQALALALLAVWVLFDARWLDDLWAKHPVVEQLYADKPWAAREALQADEDTLAAAREVSRLAAQQGVRRILVLSDSPFTFLRMIYFLLPLNTAPLGQALGEAPGAPLPRDALIAVLGSEARYDEGTGMLAVAGRELALAPLYARGDLRVYRAAEAAR